MTPLESRLILIALGLTELLFGLGYNALIGISDRFPWGRWLTAFAVVIGDAVTLTIIGLFYQSPEMWSTIGIIFYGFAFSGLPMIIGFAVRHQKALVAERKAKEEERKNHKEEEKLRNEHRGLRWPKNMKDLRDSAAEALIEALRVLNKLHMDGMDPEDQNVIHRARGALTKALMMLVKAGAQVNVENL